MLAYSKVLSMEFYVARVCLAHYPFKVKKVPGAIRTPDLQLRRLTLYPAELQAHKGFISGIGANV